MGKIRFIMEKNEKQETLEVEYGMRHAIGSIKKLFDYDRRGFMIVAIDGDNPIEEKNVVEELRNQMNKGSRRAIEDVKKDFEEIKKINNKINKGKNKLMRKSWVKKLLGREDKDGS